MEEEKDTTREEGLRERVERLIKSYIPFYIEAQELRHHCLDIRTDEVVRFRDDIEDLIRKERERWVRGLEESVDDSLDYCACGAIDYIRESEWEEEDER